MATGRAAVAAVTSPALYGQEILNQPASAFGTPSLVNPGPSSLEPLDSGSEQLEFGQLPTKGSPRLMQALREMDQARVDYALADQMHDGKVGDLPFSERIARLVKRAGVNDIEDLNYAKVPVDTIAEKLGIRAVRVNPKLLAGQEPSEEQKTAAEQYQDTLDQIREDNDMDIEEDELLLRASKYGDAYLEVWPAGVDVDGPDDEDLPFLDELDDLPPVDSEPLGAVGFPVDIYVDSPMIVRAYYDQEQPRRITHVLKFWEKPAPEESEQETYHRATLYDTEGYERWVCEGDPNRAEDWKPLVESEQDEWPAPYPSGVDRIPFFHFRNARPYGCPEHKPAYGPQRLINKIVSAEGVSIDYQIFPQRYALIDPKADGGLLNLVDPDNPEDEDDDPEGEGSSQLRAEPGVVWRLNAKTVGQFDPADPMAFITVLDRYIRAIAELCGIPLDRFTGYTTPPSGESRRVGSEVLYEKVNARRRRYQRVLADAYQFALQLAGVSEDVVVSVTWEPLAIATGTDDWNVVSAKISNGVPVDRALVEAGYPEDDVKQWLLDQSGADLVRRVALLNQVGTAVQTLASGVAVGMVSREQAADLIARVMGEIATDLPDTDRPVTIEQPPTPPMAPQPDEDGNMPEDKPVQFDPMGRPIPSMPPLPNPTPPLQVGVTNSAGE